MDTKIERSTKGLRDFLFDQLDKLNAGTADPVRVNVATKTAATILATAKVEMDHAAFQARQGKLGDRVAPTVIRFED